jgi:phenylalanine-4-hydroxylase
MDSMADINAPWIEAEDLLLPQNHPGLQDGEYVRRRKMFFYLARDLRLREFDVPCLPYSPIEQDLWRSLFRRLDELHRKHAAKLFLDGKFGLHLTADRIPQLMEMERYLVKTTGVRLVPAEGLLHGKSYFNYWAKRVMPCTLFLRHASSPEYTPEPDIVHDVIGHVPPLMNKEYVDRIELIGKASLTLGPDELEELVRFYWFTVEFGLIQEAGKMKILGAGILSSLGEMEHVVSEKVKLRPFDLEEILATPFDPTHLQPKLFVAPSLDAIVTAAQEVLRRFEIRGKASSSTRAVA